jgi:hypothetical protein
MIVTRVTAGQALEWLREVVDLRGVDYIYKKSERTGAYSVPDCYYSERTEDGKVVGSCGVGVVFERHLPELFAYLAKYEHTELESMGVFSVSSRAHKKGVEFSYDAIQVLEAFQRAQDDGLPYAEALARAESEFEGQR